LLYPEKANKYTSYSPKKKTQTSCLVKLKK